MRLSILRHLFFLLLLFGITCFLPADGSAEGCAVSVTPNASDSTVQVTVSDTDPAGKEISVVCYEPGLAGNVNDLTANKKQIVYINQYTVNGTVSFSFQIKKPLVQGTYSLVVTSEKGQTVTTFHMIPEVKESAKPLQPSATPDSPGKKPASKAKVLKVPAGVKVKAAGKKKVTVTWKKVAGAKGYIIGVSAKKSGKYKTKLTVKGGSKKKATLKKLKGGKVYYIRVRAYQLSGKKKVTGKWSKALKVKVRG